MKPDFTSLRSKLTVSLALIAGVAIAATLVTALTLDRVGRTVADRASEDLAVSAANARFAEIGQAIRVDVPALGNAQTQFERRSALARLQEHFRVVGTLAPQTPGADAGYFSGLDDVQSNLEANVWALDDNVSRRFVLDGAIRENIARINRLHGDFLLEVDPLLVDAKFNVEAALQAGDASGGAGSQQRERVVEEIRMTEALGRLHANANLAVGIMLRGASETGFREIEHLQARLVEVIDDGNENAEALANNSSAITLRQIWRKIAGHGDGPDRFLDLKARSSGLMNESIQLQETNSALLGRLGEVVAGAVRASGQRSTAASGEIGDIVSRGQVFNAASTALLLALLLAFLILFVRGQLFQRLMKVLSSMRLIADGTAGVVVGVSGRDEIGQLADAVRLFRDRSHALDLHAKELKKTNRTLVREVDRRRRAETDLRETQAELVQAAKLAALGQLSAGIAHEFNQPLMAMRSYAHNARRYIELGELDRCGDKIADIERLIERLSKSSNHLKTFARRPQKSLSRHDPVEVVSNALSLFEERIRSERVALEVNRPDHAVHVMTEPALLEQVVVNLVSNALDAMKDVSAPRLTVTISETDKLARIGVADNGTGFADAAAAEKAFDPFFTTKPPGEGLGLGLSISYNVIRDLGGRLEVRAGAEGGVLATIELFKS